MSCYILKIEPESRQILDHDHQIWILMLIFLPIPLMCWTKRKKEDKMRRQSWRMRKKSVIRKLERSHTRSTMRSRDPRVFNRKVTSAPKCEQLSFKAKNLLTRLPIGTLFSQLHSLICDCRKDDIRIHYNVRLRFGGKNRFQLFSGSHPVIRSRITTCTRYHERPRE